VGSGGSSDNEGQTFSEEKMKQLLKRLWAEEEGQDLTEYALLLVLLTLAAIGSLSSLATAINGVFSSVTTNLNT
jgi:pilus assembly protein Flp/PilA